MRWAGRRVAMYAHGAPTDMRKGLDSLCGMVTERLARNPLSGDVFLVRQSQSHPGEGAALRWHGSPPVQ